MSDFTEELEFQEENSAKEKKMKESKSEKFERLASKKVNQILDEIEQLRSLSNTQSYEYSPEQVSAMFSAVERRLSEVKKDFAPKKKEGRFSF